MGFPSYYSEAEAPGLAEAQVDPVTLQRLPSYYCVIFCSPERSH